MTRLTFRHVASLLLLAALAVTSATAQSPSPPQQPPKPAEPARTEDRPPRPVEAMGLPSNIKLDLTITDQGGSGDPARKVVTMVVADRGTGSIRSGGVIRPQGRVHINVDATPTILQNGTIRLRLGLEYSPRAATTDGGSESPTLNEQMTVLLEPNKPLVVSQAADPASDRRITVEVRATTLR